MIITYEVGDYANVEDNIDAGDLAACDVRLIKKTGSNKWIAENLELNFGPKNPTEIDEVWLRPI